jgi:hypothetical protein
MKTTPNLLARLVLFQHVIHGLVREKQTSREGNFPPFARHFCEPRGGLPILMVEDEDVILQSPSSLIWMIDAYNSSRRIQPDIWRNDITLAMEEGPVAGGQELSRQHQALVFVFSDGSFRRNVPPWHLWLRPWRNLLLSSGFFRIKPCQETS